MTTEGPTEEVEFIGPNDDGWYRTQIPDWIALCPQVTHTAYRLYVIVRSLILEKRPTKKVRLLSHEQLAFLLPGPNGKPSGVRTVKDALQVLTQIGLVSNPDGERIVTSGGKGVIHTRRRYQLHDWPTVKVSMTVWRNSFDKLDAFTQDWRQTRTDVFAGENVGRDSAPRSDQAQDAGSGTPDATPQDDVSAGENVGRDSARRRRDSARRRRDSARNADTTSDDVAPLKQFPQGVSSSSGGSTTSPTPEDSGEEDDDSPTAEKKPRGVRPVDLIQDLTDATDDDAQALWESIRPNVRTSPGGLIRHMAANGDLDYRLGEIRAQRASESRTEANQATEADTTCQEHREQLPCIVCDTAPRPVLNGLLKKYGPIRRPDIAHRLDDLTSV